MLAHPPKAEFIFGDGWAAYEGSPADHSPHAHVAVQLAVARSGLIDVDLDEGRVLRGRALIIGPRVRHRMAQGQASVLLIYLETHTPLVSKLLALIAPAEAAVAPQPVSDLLSRDASAGRVVADLQAWVGVTKTPVDPRLEQALITASEDPAPGAITRAATAVGLSAARLRALAQAQLSAPLSQWLLWRKLERSGRALAGGATAADSALAGGFADQAHLSRTMKRMFGVTPVEAARSLGPVDDRFIQ